MNQKKSKSKKKDSFFFLPEPSKLLLHIAQSYPFFGATWKAWKVIFFRESLPKCKLWRFSSGRKPHRSCVHLSSGECASGRAKRAPVLAIELARTLRG